MFVSDRMSSPPITITQDTSFQDALKLMQDHGFRRLPVVDGQGQLVGIISERDLLYASPSPATSLSMWELHYLLSQLRISRLMTRDVVSTTPDTPIEDAAYLMARHKVGGLPVVDDRNQVVGVITETDLFKTFVQVYSWGEPGLRLTLKVPDRKGVLADLTKAIFEQDGDIVSVSTLQDEPRGDYRLVLKVQDVSQDQLVESIEALGDQVIDARAVEAREA
jgi:acetoin utilization protein AcuB